MSLFLLMEEAILLALQDIAESLKALVDMLAAGVTIRVKNTDEEVLFEPEMQESHVLYKFKKEEPYTIEKEDDVWVIKGEEVEKLFKMTKFNTDESITRFAKRLRKMGIDDKLLELGAVEGDPVRILDFYFEFK